MNKKNWKLYKIFLHKNAEKSFHFIFLDRNNNLYTCKDKPLTRKG